MSAFLGEVAVPRSGLLGGFQTVMHGIRLVAIFLDTRPLISGWLFQLPRSLNSPKPTSIGMTLSISKTLRPTTWG